jgi:hypothetical protein
MKDELQRPSEDQRTVREAAGQSKANPVRRNVLSSRIPVFLSYPTPFTSTQNNFIEQVRDFLDQRGLGPRTLGVSDYDVNTPLTGVRRLLLESNGLISIAFRRTYIEKGTNRFETDLDVQPSPIDKSWLTSPWAHIEPAMAYQLGLPILIFREKGVIADGIFEPGVVGLYMPEFDLKKPIEEYFTSAQWSGILGKWEGQVRSVVETKGSPPKLF